MPDSPQDAMTAQMPIRRHAMTIGAAITCITLVGVALSLSSPLISLVMAGRGISATVIGLNTAFGSSATLMMAPLIPRVAKAIGLRALLFLTLASGGTMMALFPAFDSLAAWFALRFVFGASVGTLFVLSEYWITAAAPPARRGMIMGIYATALSLGFAAGPALLAAAGGASQTLFFIGASFFAVAALPILLAGDGAPPLEGKARGNAWTLVLLAPIATLASFLYGAVEQSSFAFLPLYGEMIGLTTAQAALLLTLFGLGNVLSQVPIGILSDRMDRRLLILVCALVTLAGVLALPFAAGTPTAMMALVFVTGGVVGGLYTVGLAHLGARFTGSELATANAAFVMLYAFGMFVGSPAVGVVVDAVRPHGFAYAVAALCAAYCVPVAMRMAARRD